MRKSFKSGQKSNAQDAIDSHEPGIAGTDGSLEGRVSETTIAFHYENGTVREFLATPSGWHEVPPGFLINDDLAHGYPPELAVEVLEDRVDFNDEALISKSMSGQFPLWTAPAKVPLQIVVPRGRRSFKQWMTRNNYTWAADPRTGQVRVVTRGGRLVDIPNQRGSAFEELASAAHPLWGPAIAFISLPLQQLRWAEAIVLRERGARLRECCAGHRFVWIGRTTKRWCGLHQRERDALETRYRRASTTEKKSLMADLERLGLRRGSKVYSRLPSEKGRLRLGQETPKGTEKQGDRPETS